jgi:flagellar hook-length control protein FliK
MGSSDVGAASAASTRYVAGASAPGPTARRAEAQGDGDPFGALVDRLSDDGGDAGVRADAHPSHQKRHAAGGDSKPRPEAATASGTPDTTAVESRGARTKGRGISAVARGTAQRPIDSADASVDTGGGPLAVPELLLANVASATEQTDMTASQPSVLAAMSPGDLSLAGPLPTAADLPAPDTAEGTSAEMTPDTASDGLRAAVSTATAPPAADTPPTPAAAAQGTSPRDADAIQVAWSSIKRALSNQPVERSDDVRATSPVTNDASPTATGVDQPAITTRSGAAAPAIVPATPSGARSQVPGTAVARAQSPVAADQRDDAPVSADRRGPVDTAVPTPDANAGGNESFPSDSSAAHFTGGTSRGADVKQRTHAPFGVELADGVAALESTSSSRHAPLPGDAPPAGSPRSSPRAAEAIAAFQAASLAGSATAENRSSATVPTSMASRSEVLEELPTQIVHAIRTQFANGVGEAHVKLNPGFLGGLTVAVRLDGQSVIASLQATNAEVREWIRGNEPLLRQALAQQGLQLEQLIVLDEGPDGSAGDDLRRKRDPREQEPQRRAPRTSDQGTFELVL